MPMSQLENTPYALPKKLFRKGRVPNPPVIVVATHNRAGLGPAPTTGVTTTVIYSFSASFFCS